MNKVKVGVIGTGHLGKIHTKLWKACETAELIGVYDANPEVARKVAEENGVRSFNTQWELISECDAVTIAAPTSLHYEIANVCLSADVHCFIEKPITASYPQAQDIINLARERKRIVQVGHVERFNPALASLKDYAIEPVFIESHRLAQFKPRATDVSVIHDLMIHDIDIMLSLVKSPVESIDATGVAVITDTIDIANARINFENGAVANLTASRISANPMRKMRIFQKSAYISIDFADQSSEVFTICDEGEKPEKGSLATMLGTISEGVRNRNIFFSKPEAPKINAIAEEQRSFIDAIINGSPIEVSARDAADALMIAELISDIISRNGLK
ncbi:MAG: Gfo/Idh/MocA family protein [Chloroflexota bacterium]